MKLTRLALPMVCLIVAGAGCGPRVASERTAPPVPQATGEAPPPGAALAGALSVGVPCGLAMAYKELRTQFLRQHPGVRFSERVGDIIPLTKEIADGAVQLDLLITFGETEIEPLKAAGKLRGEPTPFLGRDMDLCVQKGNPLGLKGLADLVKPQVRTVAICTADLTLGHAAEQALKAAGIWGRLQADGKITRLDQPLKAKNAVIQREADAALIYAGGKICSIANPERCIEGKADIVLTVPQESYGGMFVLATVLTTAQNPELAQQFIEFLVTPEAQDAIAEMGYGRAKALVES